MIYLCCDSYFFSSLQVIVLCSFISACRIPLGIYPKASLVIMNSLSFCSSGNVLISPSLLKYSSAGYRILGWQFFFFLLALWIYQSIAFYPPKFLMRSRIVYWRSVVCDESLLSCCFHGSLSFNSLIIMCLNVGLFMFIVLRVGWVSWVFISFIKLEVSLTTSTILYAPLALSLSSSWNLLVVN